MVQPIRILIADDYPRSRRGMRALVATWPNIEVVGEAADGAEAVHLVEACQPDVALMDVRMPVMNGLKAAKLIKIRQPWVKVIMLTMHGAYQMEALAAGADAFLIKGSPPEELRSTIVKLNKERQGDATLFHA